MGDNLDATRTSLQRRGPEAASSLERIATLAAERKQVLAELEGLRAQKNEANQAMRQLDKKSEAFASKRDALRELGQSQKSLESREREVVAALEDAMLQVPNPPHADAPEGQSEADNVEVRRWGQRPEYSFEPKDHLDLGVGLGIIDMERGAKLSGARFAVLMGAGAKLERALISLMLDIHSTEHGYTEVWPPALVQRNALLGTGQLPKFAQDVFRIEQHTDTPEGSPDGSPERELYLIPTAEVPITNLHADEILNHQQLPIAYVAYTPCFRSEAGSYGRDTRGLIRVHQFDKVELVRFETPERAAEAHQALTEHAERILQRLGLHYRVVELCSADMGFSAQRCYDLEVWLPGQQAYREISSCSWFGDFQARRAGIRYRPGPGEKPRFAHTLNGSGLAVGRTVVALLEQYQQADGSVRIPEALQPYMGGQEVLRPAT